MLACAVFGNCRIGRVPTGQGKLEKVMEFEWSGEIFFLENSGKSQGK